MKNLAERLTYMKGAYKTIVPQHQEQNDLIADSSIFSP